MRRAQVGPAARHRLKAQRISTNSRGVTPPGVLGHGQAQQIPIPADQIVVGTLDGAGHQRTVLGIAGQPYFLTSISQQRHIVLIKDLRWASLPTNSQRGHSYKRLWPHGPSKSRRVCARFGIVLECTKCNL
jgi:hypothetical protein